MTPIEYVMDSQRRALQALNSETLRLKMTIITAASHAHRGNPEAAIKLIIDTSEAINSETTNQLANDHARTANQN